MNVDILANDRASFIQPMAEGLARMLEQAGATPRVHLDGLAHLMRALSIDLSTPRSFVGSTMKLARKRSGVKAVGGRMGGRGLVVVVGGGGGSVSPWVF